MTTPLFKVRTHPSAALAVAAVLESGYIGQGERVAELERRFGEAIGVTDPPPLTVNSCTSALDLAMHLIGVGEGDEVITTPMTCLGHHAQVRLADGSTRAIGAIVNNRENVEVLAMGADGRLVPRRVTDWIKLPADGVDWYRVHAVNGRGSRGATGKAGIWITGDHKLWTRRGWVRVDELAEDDEVATGTLEPSREQREVIDGTLLGDGLLKAAQRGSSRLEWGHADSQREWGAIKAGALSEFGIGVDHRAARPGHQPSTYWRTRSSGYWSRQRQRWYVNARPKSVPSDIAMTPRLLATWYMDDGSINQNQSLVLCTDGFSAESVWRLFWMIFDEFGIKPSVRSARKGLRIAIGNGIDGHDSARKFFDIIGKYVPPSMRYKVPDDAPPYDPRAWDVPPATVSYDRVVATRGKPPSWVKPQHVYCLEVESDHNFLAGDLVVSNCTATNSPLMVRGATPVWADVDPRTGLIDPMDVAAKITLKTRAIIAVDWAGRRCDYAALRGNGVPVVQDAAHLGPMPLGASRGDYVAYSFQAIKFLTTGDGGALLVPPDQYERAKLLRWYGLDREGKADFRCEQNITEVGYKYHLNDIAAALGLANLHAARLSVRRAQENARYYYEHLAGLPGLEVPLYDGSCHYWLFTVLADDRASLTAHLAEHGIATSQVHARNDRHAAFWIAAGGAADLPGVDAFDSRQANIPVGWWVSNEERHRIVVALQAWAAGAARRAA